MKGGRRAQSLLLLGALLVAVVLAERAQREGIFDPAAGDDANTGAPADAIGPCRARRVVDGDTAYLVCAGEELHVRLLRIDTPERDEPGYQEATRALRAMLAGGDLQIAYEEPGRPARGNYGRLLAYVFAEGRHVNVEMVRQGWSRFDTRWGEGRFARSFREAEREARRAGRL